MVILDETIIVQALQLVKAKLEADFPDAQWNVSYFRCDRQLYILNKNYIHLQVNFHPELLWRDQVQDQEPRVLPDLRRHASLYVSLIMKISYHSHHVN